MIDDPEDPTEAYARSDDPATSHDAANAVRKTKLESLALAHLRASGAHGATTVEIAQAAGMPRDSISPRMRSLERKGLAIDTGTTRVIAGSNRSAIVWLAVTPPPPLAPTPVSPSPVLPASMRS